MKLPALDVLVIVAYLAGIASLGWSFSRKQKDTRDYFLSDKTAPWWALAGSIIATETSTVTFISVPAFAFAANSRGEGGNLTFLQLAAGYLVGRLIVSVLFIPLYFKGELFTVYQALDYRFRGRVKRTAASLFLITRSLADGVRLYATALVVTTLTGWPDWASILLVGVITVLYTYVGGIAAVIWTDVIQFLIYIAGALLACWILLNNIPGGWTEVAAVGAEFNKFQMFDFSTSIYRSYTFWAGIIGGTFLTTATHGADQLIVQRYLCSKNAKQATAALLVSGIVVFAQFVLFLFIGIMLFVYYLQAGNLPAEISSRPDRVFPHFIVTELPTAAVGLVIAALLAAAMSTLSSSLNSSAATSLADFYKPLTGSSRSESHYLGVARSLTALWGAVQIGVAAAAIAMQQRTVDAVLAIASFTNGPILGLFLLSAVTKRVGDSAALVSVAAGITVMTAIWTGTGISWQWYVLIGSAVTFSTGCAASIVLDRKTEVLKGE